MNGGINMRTILIRYTEHSTEKMGAAVAKKIQENTGYSIDEWKEKIRIEKFLTQQEIISWLKTKYRLGENTAWYLSSSIEQYKKTSEQKVEELFSGKKIKLRGLYNRLMEEAMLLGRDVTAEVAKTLVSIRRKYVIAQIKPNMSRIDFGLALGSNPFTDRLLDTGGYSKKDRITHYVPLHNIKDFDEEVIGWLRKAYERDG